MNIVYKPTETYSTLILLQSTAMYEYEMVYSAIIDGRTFGLLLCFLYKEVCSKILKLPSMYLYSYFSRVDPKSWF